MSKQAITWQTPFSLRVVPSFAWRTQSNKDWQTWKDNHLNVTPDNPGFPKDIAGAAGLEAPYRARLKPDEH
jgi:hypothetical protein